MPHFKYHAIFLIKFHIKVMQKFFLFFVKKLLTKFLTHSIISNVSGTRQNTKQYARVAQLVEHDLAKVGAAGSSPVSCSCLKPRNIVKSMLLGFLLRVKISVPFRYSREA